MTTTAKTVTKDDATTAPVQVATKSAEPKKAATNRAESLVQKGNSIFGKIVDLNKGIIVAGKVRPKALENRD